MELPEKIALVKSKFDEAFSLAKELEIRVEDRGGDGETLETSDVLSFEAKEIVGTEMIDSVTYLNRTLKFKEPKKIVFERRCTGKDSSGQDYKELVVMFDPNVAPWSSIGVSRKDSREEALEGFSKLMIQNFQYYATCLPFHPAIVEAKSKAATGAELTEVKQDAKPA